MSVTKSKYFNFAKISIESPILYKKNTYLWILVCKTLNAYLFLLFFCSVLLFLCLSAPEIIDWLKSYQIPNLDWFINKGQRSYLPYKKRKAQTGWYKKEKCLKMTQRPLIRDYRNRIQKILLFSIL